MGWKELLTLGVGLLLAVGAGAADNGKRNRSVAPNGTAGVCFLAPNEPEIYSLQNVLDPKVVAGNYLWSFEHRLIPNTEAAKVTVLQQPTHGVMRLLAEADRGKLFDESSSPIDPADPGYVYLPQNGYVGKDKAIALVAIAGVKIKVIYYFQAIEGRVGDVNNWCGKRGYEWKISSTLDADGNSRQGLVL